MIPRSYGRLLTGWFTVALASVTAALASSDPTCGTGERVDAQTHPKLPGCGRMIPHELDPDGRQTETIPCKVRAWLPPRTTPTTRPTVQSDARQVRTRVSFRPDDHGGYLAHTFLHSITHWTKCNTRTSRRHGASVRSHNKSTGRRRRATN